MARGELGLLFFLIVIILFGDPTLKELKEVWLWIAFLRCSVVPIFLVTLNLCLSSCPSKTVVDCFVKLSIRVTKVFVHFIEVPHVVINNHMDLQGHWKWHIFTHFVLLSVINEFYFYWTGDLILDKATYPNLASTW